MRTYALAAQFKDPDIVVHPGGHFTPASWPVKRMADFILEQAVPVKEAIAVEGEVVGFEEKMDHSLDAAIRNPGGTFIPIGMGPSVEKLFQTSTFDRSLDWFRCLLNNFGPKTAQDEGTMDDLLLLAYTIRHAASPSKSAKGPDVFLHAWLALYGLNPHYMLKKVETIPTYGAWKDLTNLAVLNSASARPGQTELHKAIVDIFADRLANDHRILVASLNKSEEEEEVSTADLMDITDAARGAPNKGNHADKTCHLASDIALALRPIEAAPGQVDEERYEKEKLTTYVGYQKLVQRLRHVLDARDSPNGLVDPSGHGPEHEMLLGRITEEDRAAILAAAPTPLGR